MNKLKNSHLIHFYLPVPEGFTGQILVNVEKGIATNGFPLRSGEFVGSVDSFLECCRLAGFQIIPPQ
ncbi:TPA: hypothetical protein ACTYR0_005846 [Klebsiella michiganensis]